MQSANALMHFYHPHPKQDDQEKYEANPAFRRWAGFLNKLNEEKLKQTEKGTEDNAKTFSICPFHFSVIHTESADDPLLQLSD